MDVFSLMYAAIIKTLVIQKTICLQAFVVMQKNEEKNLTFMLDLQISRKKINVKKLYFKQLIFKQATKYLILCILFCFFYIKVNMKTDFFLMTNAP